MASIVDLCWMTSQDLLKDIDLDSLYARQLRAIGADRYGDYPYLLLVHTGKITIGISLGNRFDGTACSVGFGGSGGQTEGDLISAWKNMKEFGA